jgi:hypothetical protein
MIRILNQKDSIPESEVKKALEWKPWEDRRDEVRDKVLRQRPVPSDKGYEDHMKVQAEIMRQIQEVLIETEDEDFYKVHEELIEEVYAQLDEGNKVEFKTFMLDLYRLRRRRVQYEGELQNKLTNAKNFIKQSEDPDFMVKNSDFIDVVYEELRSPGDAQFLNEFGKFLEELWEDRNPKPRLKVMRLKQKKIRRIMAVRKKMRKEKAKEQENSSIR